MVRMAKRPDRNHERWDMTEHGRLWRVASRRLVYHNDRTGESFAVEIDPSRHYPTRRMLEDGVLKVDRVRLIELLSNLARNGGHG